MAAKSKAKSPRKNAAAAKASGKSSVGSKKPAARSAAGKPPAKKPATKSGAKKPAKRKAAPRKPLIGLDPFAELAASTPPAEKIVSATNITAASDAGEELPHAEAVAVAPPTAATDAGFEDIEMPVLKQPSGRNPPTRTTEAPASVDPADSTARPASEPAAPDPVAVQPDADAKGFVLPEALVLQNVAEIYPQFVHALDREGDLQLDATAVSRVDTAGMQLLLAMAQSAQQLGRKVHIEGAGELLIEKARVLGFTEELKL